MWSLCVCVLLSSSIFIYMRGRSTKIEGMGGGGEKEGGAVPWLNAKVLHKDTELISNVCIYVFNFTVARSWGGVGGSISISRLCKPLFLLWLSKQPMGSLEQLNLNASDCCRRISEDSRWRLLSFGSFRTPLSIFSTLRLHFFSLCFFLPLSFSLSGA